LASCEGSCARSGVVYDHALGRLPGSTCTEWSDLVMVVVVHNFAGKVRTTRMDILAASVSPCEPAILDKLQASVAVEADKVPGAAVLNLILNMYCTPSSWACLTLDEECGEVHVRQNADEGTVQCLTSSQDPISIERVGSIEECTR
jgi:hypothetical protein